MKHNFNHPSFDFVSTERFCWDSCVTLYYPISTILSILDLISWSAWIYFWTRSQKTSY